MAESSHVTNLTVEKRYTLAYAITYVARALARPPAGFQHEANLDEGGMWPVAFALTELTAAEEARIVALVKKALN